MSMLRLNNVSLTFSSLNKTILQPMSYEIRRGDFIILLGSNGSGKSTLLKLLHRHHQPSSGTIHFLGQSFDDLSDQSFSQQVAVLTQHVSESLFTTLTVYENYLLMKKTSHAMAADRLFLKTYLADFNPYLSEKLDHLVEPLSGGEKQALALALCLLNPPTLLLLDEHTSALDPKTSTQIMQLTQRKIVEHQITCILTTHDLDIALQYGNRILVLHEGKIRAVYEEAEKKNVTRQHLIATYG